MSTKPWRTASMLVAATLGALTLPAPARAIPVDGTLNIVGDLRLGGVVTPSGLDLFVDFLPPVAGAMGSFLVTSGLAQTGDFLPLAFTTGAIRDFAATPGPAALAAFLTFAPAPDIRFDLTRIEPGAGGALACFVAPAPGQTCAPPGSALTFVNLAVPTVIGSVAAFTVGGNAVRLGTGEMTPFVGAFTTQFPDRSYQSVLASLIAGGTVTAAYSATFTVSSSLPATSIAPEPSTLSLVVLAGGVAAAGGAVRRRRSTAA